MNAALFIDNIPVLPAAKHYQTLGAIPGGTHRNYDSYGHKAAKLNNKQIEILCDPQTSGGLLVAVEKNEEKEFLEIMQQQGFNLTAIGKLHERPQATASESENTPQVYVSVS